MLPVIVQCGDLGAAVITLWLTRTIALAYEVLTPNELWREAMPASKINSVIDDVTQHRHMGHEPSHTYCTVLACSITPAPQTALTFTKRNFLSKLLQRERNKSRKNSGAQLGIEPKTS